MMGEHSVPSPGRSRPIGAGQTPEAVSAIRRRGRSLRARLLILVLVSILPLTAAAVGLLVWNAVLQHRDQEAMLLARARLLADLADQKLRTTLVAFQTLSLSRRLAERDLAGFYEQALALRRFHPDWQSVLVIDPSGQQLLNLLRPLGSPLPNVGDVAVIQQVIATGQPQISGVFVGPVALEPIVSVSYPVHEDGRLAYILANNLPTRVFAALLAEHQPDLPWRAIITDRDGRIVARSPDHDRWAGQPARPWFVAGTAGADEGLLTGRTLDGVDVDAAFSRSRLAGWVVSVALPTDVLQAPLRRSLTIAAAISVASLLLSAGLALWFGRAITRPITGLVAAARAIRQRRDPGPLARSAIPELETLGQVMEEAGREVSLAARTERARIVSIFRSMTDGVVEVDRDWRVTLINGHAQAWLAGGREVRGRTLWDAFPEPIGTAVRPHYQRARDDQVPVEFEASCPASGAWYGVRAFPTPEGLAVYFQDITPRKRAEQALRDSEARLRRALADAPFPVMLHAEDGTVLQISRSWTEITGYTAEAIPTIADWTERAYGERRDLVRASIDQLYALDRRVDEGEFVVTTEQGERRVWAFASAPLGRDAQGRRLVVSMAADITARKAAEAALQAKMAEMESVLDAVPAMVFIAHDRRCHQITASRYTYAMLGLPFGSNVSRSPPAGEPPPNFRAVQDGADLPPETLPMQVAAATGAEVRGVEFELALADGRRLHVLGNAVPLRDAAGESCGAIGAFVDITARKEMETLLIEHETRLRLALDSVEAGIWDWNSRSDQVYLSPRLKGFAGYGEDLPESNKAWLALVHPEDLSLFKRRTRDVLKGGEQQYAMEYRIRHRDGTYRWIQSNARILRDSRGVPVRMTGLDLDITEERRAELALRDSEQRQKRLQQQLMQISRLSAIGEVASTLAHELNQPLTATINYVQAAHRMVTAGSVPAANRLGELMDKAVAQASRAATIIRRVRAFIAMGEAPRALESVNEVVTEASLLGLGDGADNHVAVRFDLTPDLPPCLMDKVQIQQVVFNLVRNAIEAMAGAERREITIRTSCGDDTVEVAVCDTGPGVAAEVGDRVFQPFVTTKTGGMGLGLAVCRSIVEAHNGRLELAPNPEGGAIFRFCLPIAGEDNAQDARQSDDLYCG